MNKKNTLSNILLIFPYCTIFFDVFKTLFKQSRSMYGECGQTIYLHYAKPEADLVI